MKASVATRAANQLKSSRRALLPLGLCLLLALAMVASPAFAAAGDSIDNTQCEGSHDNDYHVHDAVFVYVAGSQVQLPRALGQVPSAGCLYWIHTHADSSYLGIIHIEAPLAYNSLVHQYLPQNFTLQQFVDIWSQTSPGDALPVSDGWSVFVDGRAEYGSFSTISLNPDYYGHHIIVMALWTELSTVYLPDAYTFDWHGL